MFKPNHFNVKEMVDEQVYNLLGEQAWNLIDIRIRKTQQVLKDVFGWIIIVNTWMFSTNKYGQFSHRGFRAAVSDVGSKGGSHYKGMGLDFDAYIDGQRLDPDLVRKRILDNIDMFPYIRCLEIDINWIHIDVMGWLDHEKRSSITDNKILLYSPEGNSKIIRR